MSESLDEHTLRLVAAEADVDPRTLRRALEGQRPRARKDRESILRALEIHEHRTLARVLKKEWLP